VAYSKLRHRARERALQFLFGLAFTGYPYEDELDAFWENNPAKPAVRQYGDTLIRGVCERREELDGHISEALEHWTPERIGYVERAALRIALYEMLYAEDVPANVAINEAIELVKQYGTDESPRFVNGVLDRLRKQVK